MVSGQLQRLLLGVICSGMGSACATWGVAGVSARRGRVGDRPVLEGSLQMCMRRLVWIATGVLQAE